VQIANGVEMLEISAVIMGKAKVIHPTLFWDGHEVILVDAGYPGQLPLFREAMEKAQVPFDKLSKIIITHPDIDHIGSLPAIVNALPQKAEVLASAVEKPYIEGEKRPVKITPEAITHALASLPPDVPEEKRQALKTALENPPKADVDRAVGDGEELPYCGGITVISTPGHTPGHICLYHQPSRTLVAGDALTVIDGRLAKMNPQLTFDREEAKRSLNRLSEYDIETVICYHGGLYKGNANQRIAELAQT